MTTRDIYNDNVFAQIVAPANTAAAVTSAVIDTQNGEALVVVANIGTSGDTLSGTTYWTFKLIECTTIAGTYNDVLPQDIQYPGSVGNAAVGNAFVVNSPALANSALKLGYKGGKRYVKMVATPTNVSSGMVIGAIAVLGSLHLMPA